MRRGPPSRTLHSPPQDVLRRVCGGWMLGWGVLCEERHLGRWVAWLLVWLYEVLVVLVVERRRVQAKDEWRRMLVRLV